MNNIDTIKWKTFKLSEIFYEPDTGKDLIYRDLINGSYPVIGHCKEDNGVTCWTEKLDDYKLYDHHKTISLGDRGCFVAYVQPIDFYIGTRVKALTSRNKDSNVYQLQFITTCINLEQFKFCYGRNATDKVSDITIKLPAIKTKRGKYKPDWQYMESYIKESTKQIEKTKNLDSSLKLNIQDWKEFSLNDIFTNIEDGKVTKTEVLDEGNNICYCGAKKNNNSVIQKYAYNKKYISRGNCIAMICDGQGSIGYNTYQKDDFIATVNLSLGYNNKINKYNGLFLVTVLDLERPKFSFGRKRKATLKSAKIKLPAIKKSDGTYVPDWKFMENYIKSLPYGDLI